MLKPAYFAVILVILAIVFIYLFWFGQIPQKQGETPKTDKDGLKKPGTEGRCIQDIINIEFDGIKTASEGVGSEDSELCWVKFGEEDSIFIIESGGQRLKIFRKSGNSGLTASFDSDKDQIILGDIKNREIGQNAATLSYYYNDILKLGSYYDLIPPDIGKLKVVTATDIGVKEVYKANLDARNVITISSSNKTGGTGDASDKPAITAGENNGTGIKNGESIFGSGSGNQTKEEPTTTTGDQTNLNRQPSSSQNIKTGKGSIIFNNVSLVSNGIPKAKIILGEGMDLGEYGISLINGNISLRTGISLEAKTPDKLDAYDKSNYNLIVVGNPQENSLTKTLVDLRYSDTDWSIEEGSIETINDVFSIGKFVIIVAGKDKSETRKASEGFANLLEFIP